MARNNQRGSKNNNSEGRNQFSGWRGTAKERPVATAAAAAAAVGAGVFLWSRRNQISDQISNLSDQFSDWTSNQQYGGSDNSEFEFADSGNSSVASGSAGSSASGGRGGSNRSRGKSGGQGSTGSTGSTGTTGSTDGQPVAAQASS